MATDVSGLQAAIAKAQAAFEAMKQRVQSKLGPDISAEVAKVEQLASDLDAFEADEPAPQP
jgi:outer membrane murein-binding lipoprotein Lpp